MATKSKKAVAPASAPAHAVSTGLQEADPGLFLMDKNYRFGLKDSRVASMERDIISMGGIHTPVEVEELNPPVDGHLFRVTDGHYRIEAAAKANAKGAGIKVPYIVIEPGDDVARLKRQRSHNSERENETPMDKANFIKRAMDLGVPRATIMEMMATPGGRKGAKTQPASNSFLNIHLKFLEFPPKIQNMIHEGDLGVAAAMELGRRSPEHWDTIIAQAEAERTAEAEREEKDEERFLKEQKRIEEEAAKAVKLQAETQQALDEAAQKRIAADALMEKFAVAQKAALTTDKKDKKTLEKAKADLAKADAEMKEALKAKEAAESDAEKKRVAQQKLADLTENRRKKLEEARAGKRKAVGPTDVKKAAAGAGLGAPVPLTANQMREVVQNASLGGANPTTRPYFIALAMCFKGEIDERKFQVIVGLLTGDRKAQSSKADKDLAASIEETCKKSLAVPR